LELWRIMEVQKMMIFSKNGVWKPKYGVVLVKFVTHQVRGAMMIKIDPFYPLDVQNYYF
jgi:hypothetical protein